MALITEVLVPRPEILDLSKFLGKVKNRIERVGIELEGGWTMIPVGVRLHTDTSVQVKSDPGQPPLNLGEIVSEPLQPARVGLWMKKFYPSKTNSTCGLHVHMSFKTLRMYQVLMDTPAYQNTVVEYLRVWAKSENLRRDHPLWNRLEGESEFCQNKFWPDLQARHTAKDYDKQREGHRYTIISYGYRRHGTIECRVLPMMDDINQSIRAVNQVLDITNASLVVLGKQREEKFKGTVDESEIDVYSERVVQLL